MGLTKYYFWKDRHSRVALFVADDDPRYSTTSLVQSCCLKDWLSELEAFKGFAVVVLDSLIAVKSDRTPRPVEYGAWNWCDEHKLGMSLPTQRIVVVVSGGPGEAKPPVHRWYWKGADVVATLDTLKDLALRTAKSELRVEDWPKELRSQVDALSAAIHGLQNVFQPVGWDSEKLSELVESPDTTILSEIFRDHIASGVKAYLGSRSKCHDGGDILQCVGSLCDSLGQDVRAEVEGKIKTLEEMVRTARTALEGGVIPSPVAVELPSAAELHKHLRNIAIAGDALLESLRMIRKREQEKTK